MNLIKEKRWAIIFSLMAMLLWGSAIPLIKLTYLHAGILPDDPGGKIFIAGIRFFMAGLLTYIYFFLFNKEKVERDKINFKFIIILALIQTTLQYSTYYIGLSNTLGSLAAVIQASNAFITVIISVILIADEKLTGRKLAALIIGSIGLLIINLKDRGSFHFKLTGEGFILIATTLNALASVLIRKYGRDQNSFLMTGTQFLLGATPLIIIGVLTHTSLVNFDLKLFLMLSYGAFISATSFTIWTSVLQAHSASEFGIYKLFIPIFGTILSVLFLGEELTIYIILGLIFVLLGAVVLNKK
ncbi:MAG: DMT family transporter [Peptoniphilus grossensis]|uniref:DMT family transporter n=1 Tax=Peptoniphilus grossensis TaxID=1465756 RepID=UPI00258C6F9C|nr:DMT family transporter [Peptoniphilus grossensis]MDU5099744.1 DMT family transporter [Peptoniphilus grossensis]